jgi:hypothetical protein
MKIPNTFHGHKKYYEKQLSEKWSELVHCALNQMTNKNTIFISLMLILPHSAKKLGETRFESGWDVITWSTWSDIRARKRKSNKISAVSLVAINLNYCFIYVYVRQFKKEESLYCRKLIYNIITWNFCCGVKIIRFCNLLREFNEATIKDCKQEEEVVK